MPEQKQRENEVRKDKRRNEESQKSPEQKQRESDLRKENRKKKEAQKSPEQKQREKELRKEKRRKKEAQKSPEQKQKEKEIEREKRRERLEKRRKQVTINPKGYVKDEEKELLSWGFPLAERLAGDGEARDNDGRHYLGKWTTNAASARVGGLKLKFNAHWQIQKTQTGNHWWILVICAAKRVR